MLIMVAIMYVDTATSTRHGKTYTRHLLRTSYRDKGKVKHKTVANLSECSNGEIAAIKLSLKHKAADPKDAQRRGGAVRAVQRASGRS
jgi:hypothetical protein